MRVRQEESKDYSEVAQLIEMAFREEEMSDHQESHLVARLRQSSAFIPELSLVAEEDGQIIGQVLLTKIQILHENQKFPALALAPISVLPAFQKKGVGAALMHRAHEIARAQGHLGIILLGHADYYPKFGYRLCEEFGITLPFEAPKENCMVLPLYENSLQGVRGRVEYPAEFRI